MIADTDRSSALTKGQAVILFYHHVIFLGISLIAGTWAIISIIWGWRKNSFQSNPVRRYTNIMVSLKRSVKKNTR